MRVRACDKGEAELDAIEQGSREHGGDHVRSIYRKLGVHTKQEFLDLLEWVMAFQSPS